MRASELQAQVVDRGLCLGCGFCTVENRPHESAAVTMAYDRKHDHFIPIVSTDTGHDPEVYCPGASMDMPALSNLVYGGEPEDALVGHYHSISAAYAADESVRGRSASGGVTTAMLDMLFGEGAIDAAYCVVSTGTPQTRSGRLIRHADELADIHGSVYQPASFGDALAELVHSDARFAFVGLPCEIAALEEVKRTHPDLARRHVLSIGLFCGGINRFEGVDYYLDAFGVRLQDVTEIDYRYGAWPGKIRVETTSGETHEIERIRGNTRWKILRYVIGFQGYWMLPRCRMCPDQISDFADISVGDPHLPRFRKLGGGHSAVVTRSERGSRWYARAVSKGVLQEESLSRDELVESQGYTLDNRRHARAYVRVARWLGMAAPRLEVYARLRGREAWRHHKYAAVDLAKIRLRRVRLLRPLYVPWQIFEYLFITLAPRVFLRRLSNLFSNR